MIEDGIRTYLLAQGSITAIVGTDAAGSPARIFAIDRREGISLDAICYQRQTSDHLHSLTGGAGYCDATFSFDCISQTYSGAKTLANALRLVLQGYKGTMGTTAVRSVRLEDESDEFDPPDDGSAKGTYHVIAEYAFLFDESTTSF